MRRNTAKAYCALFIATYGLKESHMWPTDDGSFGVSVSGAPAGEIFMVNVGILESFKIICDGNRRYKIQLGYWKTRVQASVFLHADDNFLC